MDVRKEQEREELHKAIWNIANDLRGSVDGWDFKQYVLGIMFYRYISENIANYINEGEHEAGNTDFDYSQLTDEMAEEARKDLVATKGFFILPSQLFCNVRKRAIKDENLNETLEKVFKAIEMSAQGTDSEDDFKGLFDDIDVNSNKLGATVAKRNEKLVKLLDGIGDMKLGDYKDAKEKLAHFRYVPATAGYDEDGEVYTAEFFYNEYNLPIRSTHVDSHGKVRTVDYTYDENNNLIKEYYLEADGVETIYEYEYDANRNMIAESFVYQSGGKYGHIF